MKRLLLLLIVVAATWVGVAWGDATAEGASPFNLQQYQPKKVTKFKLKGDGASALFISSGVCGQHSAQVGASHDTSKEGSGNAETASRMFLNLFFYADSCDEQPISTSSIFVIPPEALTIGDEMDSATLNTVVEVCCDHNLLPFPVSINLTWTATGPLTKGKNIHYLKVAWLQNVLQLSRREAQCCGDWKCHGIRK